MTARSSPVPAARNRLWRRGRAERRLHAVHLEEARWGDARTSAVDGVDRIFAIAHSTKFPVASVVAVAINDVLADGGVKPKRLRSAPCDRSGNCLRAIRLAVHIERLAAAHEREAVQAQLEIQYRRFNNAMDNIVQGLRCTTGAR